ncbi:MAG: glycoside hydrolase family 97 C-terminal domain-containing protein [Bacteroidales bacterium]
MNGAQEKSVKIPLSFLSSTVYETLVLNDDPENPASVKIEIGKVSNSDTITVNLVSGGGYMCRFIPE